LIQLQIVIVYNLANADLVGFAETSKTQLCNACFY